LKKSEYVIKEEQRHGTDETTTLQRGIKKNSTWKIGAEWNWKKRRMTVGKLKTK